MHFGQPLRKDELLVRVLLGVEQVLNRNLHVTFRVILASITALAHDVLLPELSKVSLNFGQSLHCLPSVVYAFAPYLQKQVHIVHIVVY